MTTKDMKSEAHSLFEQREYREGTSKHEELELKARGESCL